MPFNSLNVQSGISDHNSTTIPLDAGETYTGSRENVEYYSSISVTIKSNAPSAAGGVQVQFSQDGTNWDIVISDNYLNEGGAFSKHYCVKSKYFRLRYVNGSSDQTYFRLQCMMHTNIQFPAANQTIAFGDIYQDAFNRLRTSNPQTLFEMTHLFDKNDLLMDELTVGSAVGTHDSNASTVVHSITNNGDRIVRQSHRYLPYQPGKSLLVLMTGVLNYGGNNGSDTESRIGYFDDNNGVYFYYDGETIGVCKRSKSTGTIIETRVPQASWNIDSLDGSGPSGITLDASKAQIFSIDMQWLGVGEIRFAVLIDDRIYYVHKFYHANNITTTYMSRASLPVRYEMIASGSNTGGSMLEICSTVASEGGYQPLGNLSTIGSVVARDIDTSDERPVLVIRLRELYSRSTVRILSVNLVNITKGDTVYRFRIYRDVSALTDLFTANLTFQSAESTSSIESNSVASFNSSNVNILPNRLVIEGYLSDVQGAILDGSERAIFLSSNITGTCDIGVLTARSLATNNQQIFGNINWTEFS